METKSGYRDFGDSSLSWWVLPIVTDEQLKNFLEINHIQAYYCGPGQGFAGKPCIRRSSSRILITQRCGLDV